MRGSTVGGLCVGMSLACGGSSVDEPTVERALTAIEGVEYPEMVTVLVLSALAEDGSRPVSAACAEPLRDASTPDPSRRTTAFASALMACPQPCGEAVFNDLRNASPTEKTRLLIAACEAQGVEDTVFGGELATLRPDMPVWQWYFGTMLISGIKEELPAQASRWDALAPRFAAGAVLGDELVDPDPAQPFVAVSKSGVLEPFGAIVLSDPGLAACGAGRVVARVVVDVNGKPLGTRAEPSDPVGECVGARLAALVFPSAVKGGAASFDVAFDPSTLGGS